MHAVCYQMTQISHLSVLSLEAVTNVTPSGNMCALMTGSVWPSVTVLFEPTLSAHTLHELNTEVSECIRTHVLRRPLCVGTQLAWMAAIIPTAPDNFAICSQGMLTCSYTTHKPRRTIASCASPQNFVSRAGHK